MAPKVLLCILTLFWPVAGEPWTPASRREVPCGRPSFVPTDSQGPLMLLCSDGVPNADVAHALRELVLKLPDKAWAAGNGAAKKATAAARDLTSLATSGFHEPDLYAGLDVLVLEDSCILKDAFWNPANALFDHDELINNERIKLQKPRAMVEPFFGDRLDPGSCYNWSHAAGGGLLPLGFEPSRFHHYSFFDRMTSAGIFQKMLQLQTSRWPLAPEERQTFRDLFQGLKADPASNAATEFHELAQKASVLIFNGGNPDFAVYVYGQFAADVFQPVLTRLFGGELVALGRSAGSMIFSADLGLSFEAKPVLMDVLLENRTAGLGWAPGCIHRPHFSTAWTELSTSYEQLRKLPVLRINDGEVVQCQGGNCSVVGSHPTKKGPHLLTGLSSLVPKKVLAAMMESAQGDTCAATSPESCQEQFWKGADDARLIRLTNAFANNLKG